MKLIFGLHLLHLLLCAVQTSGIKIQSVPDFNSEGLIVTELDQTVSLLCQAEISSAGTDVELVWLRNGALVNLNNDNKYGNSSVCVEPVIHEDNGATFTCQLGNNDTISASVTLNVTFPPTLTGEEEVSVEEEDTLVLECDIWANPLVSPVLWTQNGSRLDLSVGGFTVSTNSFTARLTASGVEKGFHPGTYQCSVVFAEDVPYNKTFHVTVTDKTLKFPLMPIVAGVVVVFCTAVFAVLSRWKKIVKCCK